MGMLDSELIFSAAQAPTATGDTPSTNVYDMGSAAGSEAIMTGENAFINVICNTVPTSAGSATVQAVLQTSPDNATWNDALLGQALAFAGITQGLPLLQAVPPVGTQRYWRVVYRIGVAALTGGAFDSYISNTIQRNISRPSGYTVQ